MRWILLAILALLLTGCATGRWIPPANVPIEEARKQAYDCQYMANMQAKGAGYMTRAIAESQFNQCLQSRGFVWIQDSQQTSVSNGSTPVTFGSSENNKQAGFVVYDELLSHSKYMKKFSSQLSGDDASKNAAILSKIKSMAEDYCKKYHYEFLSIKGANPKDYATGYLCAPSKPYDQMNPSAFKVENATSDFISFISNNYN